MAPQDDAVIAMTNRSLRTVKSELQFLADSSIISPQQLDSILSQLPSQTELGARSHSTLPTPAATESRNYGGYTPPTNQFAAASLNEKNPVPDPYPAPAPPPAYASSPPVLSMASALYAYSPTDSGDLALQPSDRIQVLEHMNDDWWRGRNERTSLEGIFPRSYVKVVDEKTPALSPQPTNYGNVPLEVSQTGGSSSQDGKKPPTKFEQNGKKFGKKMGNAAIFGAGATVGSKIVNGIF
ncbi:hypothetical protein FQN54_002510 [Arachnomyces sp. PD_36]|nr:hypothetical protein FQN54_002510 [Arachnomyces sp. PD_36]